MKKVISIVAVLVFILSLSSCGKSARVASPRDIEFLTGTEAWYYYNPITYENEKMSFTEDFGFYWGCECGEPIGDSDLYEVFDYDNDKKKLRLYNNYDNSTKTIEVISYNDYHLMLKIDGVVKDFVPYSCSFDFDYDKEYIKDYSSYVTTMEVQGLGLVVGPFNYDGDVGYPDEAFDTYMMSEDIEFYDYSYESINGKVNTKYKKLSMAEGLDAFESSSAFIWFNKNMEISKVMYYGSLIVEE
ncbi:hypothetical protein CYL18_12825 [Pradoshia eiseniae]|uniref:Lipoprotein n=1 Tax=Pradoshia eiseniae TaxID=2064768 RepID=A0A2S7MYJ4_9BACI|nr:hypothetical protein [Pradoshia eiseniae]PQD94840.1 hypothetical protein CYL18_12825 [Pradoshia eiseniae]